MQLHTRKFSISTSENSQSNSNKYKYFKYFKYNLNIKY